jgi:hypothetical protein
VNNLPVALRKDATEKLYAHERQLSSHRREREGWEAIRKAIDENDGKLAWQVLKKRRDATSSPRWRTEYG